MLNTMKFLYATALAAQLAMYQAFEYASISSSSAVAAAPPSALSFKYDTKYDACRDASHANRRAAGLRKLPAKAANRLAASGVTDLHTWTTASTSYGQILANRLRKDLRKAVFESVAFRWSAESTIKPCDPA